MKLRSLAILISAALSFVAAYIAATRGDITAATAHVDAAVEKIESISDTNAIDTISEDSP